MFRFNWRHENDEVEWLRKTKKKVMFEILKFNYKNTSKNYSISNHNSISNHVSNDEDHAWHPQRHYKQVCLVCFHGKYTYKEKNNTFKFQNKCKQSVHCNLSGPSSCHF